MGKKLCVEVGERHNLLTVTGEVKSSPNSFRTVLCRCDCGKEISVVVSKLLSGNTQSCGCKKTTRHGLSNTPTYHVWNGMMSRCYRQSNRSFPDYGGRGISVDERWHDYANFLHDVGHRPTDSHMIERIDNNKNYEPGNVEWALRKQQANNKRSNVLLVMNGKTQTLAMWCDELNLPYGTIQARLAAGWAAEKALTEPVVNKSEPKQMEYQGVTGTIADIARAFGADRKKVAKRLRQGWTMDEAINIKDGRSDRSPGGGKCARLATS